MSTLLVIKGPQIGSRFHLGGQTTIGRDETCDVRLADTAASRVHAQIERKRFSYTIRDLDSANGVFVNGEKTSERLLKRNDSIVIGATHLLFDAEPDLENALYGGKTVALGVSHEETLRAHKTLPDVAGSDEAGRVGIELIAQIGELMAAKTDTLLDLLHRAISRLVEMFRAERGAVFLWDAAGERLEPAVAVCEGETMDVDQTLLMRVFMSRQPMLASDLTPNVAALDCGVSRKIQPIGSALCAPLVTADKVDGVLLIDHGERDRFSLRDLRLLQAIGRMLAGPIEAARLRERLGRLKGAGEEAPAIIGTSRALLDLLEQARQAAGHDVPVLIEGETGTGKELIAREIHRLSRRRGGPFVAINCGAIPSELFESELFGHERGAFTGAIKTTRGRVEMAHGGTLFLDEIGEMSTAHQPKLLRFLQDHVLYRVGGSKPVRVNVRVIAATHADLEKLARENRFRLDLFFRLNVIRFRVPPLRERRDDIHRLAEYFIKSASAEIGRPIAGLTDDAKIALEHYDWPGNVRELQNVIERAVILAKSNVLERDDLSMVLGAEPAWKREKPGHDAAAPGTPEASGEIRELAEVERAHILAALERFNGNQVLTARALGIHRNTLRHKLAEYGLK